MMRMAQGVMVVMDVTEVDGAIAAGSTPAAAASRPRAAS